MKSIIAIVSIIVITFLILFFSYENPINPLLEAYDLVNQTETSINYDNELINTLKDNLTYYHMYYGVDIQKTEIKDNLTNAYILIDQQDINSYETSNEILKSISIESKGFENFIDTQGLSGTLKGLFNTYRTDEKTYVETSIALLNPPFNINIGEKQYMDSPSANNEILTILDLNALLVDPITLFQGLTLDSSNTSLFQLEYGYKLLVTYDNILLTNTKATIDIIIYDQYLIDFNLFLDGDEVTIPDNLIDGVTLPQTVDLNVEFHYGLMYDITSLLPYDSNDLALFNLVDAFTLPDISGLLDFLN